MIDSEHRPSYVQVHLEAISENLEQVMAHLPRKTQAFAVVKADAYGHGALAVARQLAGQVAGYCVSNLDEALELRQAGIEHPILILGIVPVEHLSLAEQLNISVTLASLEWLEAAKSLGQDLTGLTVHAKIDTGMGRLGFRSWPEFEQALELMDEMKLEFEGIFTHFATADEKDDLLFQEQWHRFSAWLDRLPVLPRWVHASNSATSIWHGDTVFNMVRLGDILYGLNPSGRLLDLPFEVQSGLSLYSELNHVKQVEVGATIGYGTTYRSEETEWIGTLPVGYADGVVRRLQGFTVLVDGQVCEIVGRISMDQMTIRLPKAYPLGTKVTLLGTCGDQSISVQDWADYIGTINYEVVCLLTDRLPRRYE